MTAKILPLSAGSAQAAPQQSKAATKSRLWDEPPEPNRYTVGFTIADGHQSLTKSYRIGKDGAPEKFTGAGKSVRQATLVELTGTVPEILGAFCGTLKGLRPNQALIMAVPPDGRDAWRVVTKDELPSAPGAIARTQHYFKPRHGPAFLPLDFDISGYPPDIFKKVEAAGGLIEAVGAVFPGLATAPAVSRFSSSAGIINAVAGRQTSAHAGQHRYVLCLDGQDIGPFARRLRDRLVLHGLGWARVDKRGSIRIETLIDVTASVSSERLWFEADAELAPGLKYLRGAREPGNKNPDGPVLNTRCLAELSKAEKARLADIEAGLRASALEEAAAKRAAFKAESVAKMRDRGVPESRANKVLDAALGNSVLHGEFEIPFDDNTTATVEAILADPSAFDGKTGPDPIEPDYDGGRQVAKIFVNDNGTVWIHSYAHGGQNYELKLSPAHWLDDLATAPDDSDEVDAKGLPLTRNGWLRYLNRRHALVEIGGRIYLLTEYHDGATKRVEFGPVESMRVQYRPYTFGTGRDVQNVYDAWLDWPGRRLYRGIDFAPEGTRADVYNLWQGFAVEPDPSASCELFLAHLRDNICCGNEASYRWLLTFFAQMIQKPGQKPDVAVALRGGQGTGKTIVGQILGQLFPAHHVAVSQPKHLTGNFNAHLEKALLVQVEEAFWAGDKAAAGGALKHLVTSPTMMLERKGVDAVVIRSNARLLITSNADWIVPAEMDERRFAILDVGDGRKQDSRYFGALVQQMEEEGGLGALLHFLQTYDISAVDLRYIPKTEALLDQKLHTLGMFDRWWLEELKAATVEDWRDTRDCETLYASFKTSATGNKAFVMSPEEFGRKVRAIAPGTETIRPRTELGRKRQYVLPSLATCREAFEKKIGHRMAWEE